MTPYSITSQIKEHNTQHAGRVYVVAHTNARIYVSLLTATSHLASTSSLHIMSCTFTNQSGIRL